MSHATRVLGTQSEPALLNPRQLWLFAPLFLCRSLWPRVEALGSTRTQDLTPPLTVRRPPPFVPVRSRAHSARERGSGRPVVDNGARRAPFAHEKRNSNFSTARTPDALAHTSKTHQSPLTQADEQDPTKRRTLRLPPGPEKNGSTIERYVTASPTFADDTLRPAQLGSIYAGIFIPVCVIIAIYSAMGEGIEVYSNLSREGNYAIAWYLCVAAIGWLAAMWVVDARQINHVPAAKSAVKICTVIPLGMIFIASLLAVEEYVSAPMVLFVIFKALIDKTMYDFVCPYLRIGVFMTAVGQGNFVASACVIFGWCVWMWAFDKEWNNKEMFDLYHQRLDCDRATDSLEVGRCQAAYLLWGAPLVVGLLCFFFGLACLYLAREGSAVRMLMVQFLIVGMGMWVSMSISGAEMGLADDILQFVLLFCSLMIVVCINMIGYDKVKAKIGNMRIASKIGEYSQSNFAKAMLIVISLPLFPFFLALSMMIRQSRRVGLSLAPQKRELDDEHKYFTAAAWGMLKWLFSDITSVMTWCAYIAIFYFICDVGVGKGATLFLGWMISVMKDLSPSVVLFCFILLGVSMFLLPPVPGPPVYLTGGVLLVGSMEEQLGFWGAAFLCVFVCWFTKLLSCAMQQKLFGENLSNYVSVRYAVRDQLAADARHPLLPHAAGSEPGEGGHPLRRPGLAHLRALRHPPRASPRGTHRHVPRARALPLLHRACRRLHPQDGRRLRGVRVFGGVPAASPFPTPRPRRRRVCGRDQLLADGLGSGARRRDDFHVLHLFRGGVFYGGYHREQTRRVRCVPRRRGGRGSGVEGPGEAGGVQTRDEMAEPAAGGPLAARRERSADVLRVPPGW